MTEIFDVESITSDERESFINQLSDYEISEEYELRDLGYEKTVDDMDDVEMIDSLEKSGYTVEYQERSAIPEDHFLDDLYGLLCASREEDVIEQVKKRIYLKLIKTV